MDIILTPFAKLILLFYDWTGSYGISLLLFCLVIRLILFPVFLKGRKSMLSMSGLADKQRELAQKYARNREKYSQELQKLYEEEGVKPSGGVRTYDDAIAMLKAGANRLGCSSTMKIVSGVKEDEHKCVNCGNCKNQCPSGNVEIRKKLY